MKKRANVVFIVSLITCVLSLSVMAMALMKPVKKPEFLSFTPPPFDPNAVQGTPTVPDNLGWGEIDAQVFRASICGVIIPNGSTADIWFVNPDSNTVWLKLRVLDSRGNVIGETGIIRPGEYIKTLNFISEPKVGTDIGLKLMAYEPETYYSAGSATLTTTVKSGGKQ